VAAVDDTSDLDALAAFLASVAPLDNLSPAELRAAAAGAVVCDYAPGELVIDAFVEHSRRAYIVISGEVGLWTDSEATNDSELDRFHPGSLIGFSAMLLEQPIGPRVVAATAARVASVDADLVERAFYSRSGARFLAGYIAHIRSQATAPPQFGRVADLLLSEPIIVPSDTSVAETAAKMTERGLPCAVVDLGPGEFGMISDGDLRAHGRRGSPAPEHPRPGGDAVTRADGAARSVRRGGR